MAKYGSDKKPDSANNSNDLFSTRLEVRGENAGKIRTVLEKKMKKDNRRTYVNAIEAILIEYGIYKGYIKESK